jgi:hypothetical protein
MAPLLKTFVYKHQRGNDFQEFTIKEKNYGEMILFDIFYGKIFLFTISQNGEVLLSNWESAKDKPVEMDENTLDEINSFIIHH